MVPFVGSFWIMKVFPFELFLYAFIQLQRQSVVDESKNFKSRMHVFHHGLTFSDLVFHWVLLHFYLHVLLFFFFFFFVIHLFSISVMIFSISIFHFKLFLFHFHPIVDFYPCFCLHQLLVEFFSLYLVIFCFVSFASGCWFLSFFPSPPNSGRIFPFILEYSVLFELPALILLSPISFNLFLPVVLSDITAAVVLVPFHSVPRGTVRSLLVSRKSPP